jgi:hypothetical protein
LNKKKDKKGNNNFWEEVIAYVPEREVESIVEE